MAKGDKKRFLKIASLEEWDAWLTTQADRYAPNYDKISTPLANRCFFCEAVGASEGGIATGNTNDCGRCMPREYSEWRFVPCVAIGYSDKVDRAIKRLEKAGMWR